MPAVKVLLLALALTLDACAQLQPRAELPMDPATPIASATKLDRRLHLRKPAIPISRRSGCWSKAPKPSSRACRARAWPSAASTCRPTSGTPISPANSSPGSCSDSADRGVQGAAADRRHGCAREERALCRAVHASQHRSARVQSVRVAQWHPEPGQRGGAQLQAHQPPHAQQDLDRRQPLRDRGRPQPGRRIFRRERRGEFRRSRFRHGRPGGARRVGIVRPVLEFAVRLSARAAATPTASIRSAGRSCVHYLAKAGRRVERQPLRESAARRRRAAAPRIGRGAHGVVGLTTISSPTIRSRSRWKSATRNARP